MNTWKKVGATWCVRCDSEQQPGAMVTVVTNAGKTKQVTLGKRQPVLGFVYAVAAPERPAERPVGDLAGVLALFDRAATHLKHPAIVLAVPGLQPVDYWRDQPEANAAVSTGLIRLTIAGAKAKVPGSVTVLAGERNADDSRDWFGRVLRDGTYQPSQAANGRTEAITARLRAFAAEPAKVAKDSARLTGRCCFCNTALKDERSTAVGYGETCASHFGLPWGERPEAFAEGV